MATSSVTFFRQMGGTIGTAAFLSILFTTLPGRINDAVTSAAAANPALRPQLQQLGAGHGGALDDTSFIQKLPKALALPFKTGFADSIDLVFLVAAGVVAVGFFVLIFLPQLELRTQSGIQAMQEGAGTTAVAETPAETAAKATGAAAPTNISPANAPTVGDGTRGDGVSNQWPGDGGRTARGRHEATGSTPTGLASIPADHLPQGVGRPKD